MSTTEFFNRVDAAGFHGFISPSQAKPFFVEWTGHTETVSVMGCDHEQEITVVTSYLTAADAVHAAESM